MAGTILVGKILTEDNWGDVFTSEMVLNNQLRLARVDVFDGVAYAVMVNNDSIRREVSDVWFADLPTLESVMRYVEEIQLSAEFEDVSDCEQEESLTVGKTKMLKLLYEIQAQVERCIEMDVYPWQFDQGETDYTVHLFQEAQAANCDLTARPSDVVTDGPA